jgi:hypothetical protein
MTNKKVKLFSIKTESNIVLIFHPWACAKDCLKMAVGLILLLPQTFQIISFDKKYFQLGLGLIFNLFLC